MQKMLSFVVLATMNQPAFAEQTTTKSMSFEACLAVIRQVAADIGMAPINIAETGILRIVRFPTSDGSVLVTCSKPDRKLIITRK